MPKPPSLVALTRSGNPSSWRMRQRLRWTSALFVLVSLLTSFCTTRKISTRITAESMHGFEDYAGSRRLALPDVRRKRRRVPKSPTDFKKACRPNSLRRKSRRSRQNESARQHGHEHQHRRACRRSWARRRSRSRLNDVARSFWANRRELARARNRHRRHAEPRAQLLFLRRARRQRQRDSSRAQRAISASIYRSRAPQRNNTTA